MSGHIGQILIVSSSKPDVVFDLVPETSIDTSTESLLARVPLLPHAASDADGNSSTSSSAITVRPATQNPSLENVPNNAATKPHHQREPNANGLPSTTVPSDASAVAPSALANEPGESYFTAHTPSTFSPDSELPSSASPISTPITQPTSPKKATIATPEVSQDSFTPKDTPKTPPPRPARALVQPPAASTSFELSPRVHRFSLMKAGTWNAFDMLFGSALGTGSKCDLCSKRLGWKPCLECDDCALT